MPSITIIGPGAIGGTVAAWLAQDTANQITVCTRTPFSRLMIETPYGSLVTTPGVYTAPQEVTPAQWVLIATKTYDATATAQWLPSLVTSDTRVAILQNGVEHIERFAPYVDVGALVPVVVNLPAERRQPGTIWQRGEGYFFVPDDDNGRDFARLFVHTRLIVTATPDFRSQAWRKLALNCTGALSALLLRSIDCHRNPEIIDVLRSLVHECILVGRAEGAILDDSLEEDIVTGYCNAPADSINSLHADRLAGRPMEIDARNGAVVRIGRKHGIATPANQMMATLLKAASS